MKKYNVNDLPKFNDWIEENFTPEEIAHAEREAELLVLTMKIRKEREKQNMTQEKLAKKSGVSRVTIARAERGNQNISLMKLMQIADGIGKKLEVRFV